MPGTNDGKVAGIYVIGLSRDGKGGEFLNIKEMDERIDGLARYIEGPRHILNKASGPNAADTQSERDAMAHERIKSNY